MADRLQAQIGQVVRPVYDQVPQFGIGQESQPLATRQVDVGGAVPVADIPCQAARWHWPRRQVNLVGQRRARHTGKEVGGVNLPAPQSGSPMTYTVGGKQYIVVAVSGGPYSGEYIAFRLPAAGAR